MLTNDVQIKIQKKIPKFILDLRPSYRDMYLRFENMLVIRLITLVLTVVVSSGRLNLPTTLVFGGDTVEWVYRM